MTSSLTPESTSWSITSSAAARTSRDRLRTVRPVGGVADVEHRLVRQLVEHRPGDGQAADAGVEDPDRSVRHAAASLRAPARGVLERRPWRQRA